MYGSVNWPSNENKKSLVNINDLKWAKLHLLRLKSIEIDNSTPQTVVLDYDVSGLKNLHDLLLYSPRLFDTSYEKTLFVLYQLLRLVDILHAANLTLGGGQLNLSHVYMDDNYWIRIKPPISSILDSYRFTQDELDGHDDEEKENEEDDDDENRFENDIDKRLGSCPREIKTNLEFVYDSYRHLNHRDLAQVTKSWCLGQMSNFAYLLILNCIAGKF